MQPISLGHNVGCREQAVSMDKPPEWMTCALSGDMKETPQRSVASIYVWTLVSSE